MHRAEDIRKQTATRRGFAAAVAVVFLMIFFAVPTYAAMTLCTMPCCGNEGGAETAVRAEMAGCEQECAIRADQAAPARTTAFAPEQRASVGIPFSVAATASEPSIAPPHVEERSVHRRQAAAASLHILNSIFRI